MTYVTDCSLHTYTCGPFPDLFIKLRSSERSEFPEFLWEQPHQSRCSWENIWTLEIPFKKYLKIRLWTIFPATCGKHICCVSLCLTRKWNFWGEESLRRHLHAGVLLSLGKSCKLHTEGPCVGSNPLTVRPQCQHFVLNHSIRSVAASFWKPQILLPSSLRSKQ